jgi:hypothetical protein
MNRRGQLQILVERSRHPSRTQQAGREQRYYNLVKELTRRLSLDADGRCDRLGKRAVHRNGKALHGISWVTLMILVSAV